MRATARWDACTTRGGKALAATWPSRDRRARTESCETPGPTRRTTDIPICPASTECLRCRGGSTGHFAVHFVQPAAEGTLDLRQATLRLRSDKTVCSRVD